MGWVFKALDTHLDRLVALKSISLKDIISPDQRERTRRRILREAKAQAKLGDHPNIVIVYDFGLEEDFYFIVMELIMGNDIEYYIKNKISFPMQHTLRIISDICSALDYAHNNSIIHRDIKPSNIIITQNNITKIADFGIAKILDSEETNITKTGMLVGTPYYMSPEQILGKTLDGRSDIFSLGSIFYKMLTFMNPFEGKGVIQILDAIVTKEQINPLEINPNIPPAVALTIGKALEKNRSKRYQSALEMRKDVEAILYKDYVLTPLSQKGKHEQAKASASDTEKPFESVSEEKTLMKVKATPPPSLISSSSSYSAQKTKEIHQEKPEAKPKGHNFTKHVAIVFIILLLIIIFLSAYIIMSIRTARDTGSKQDNGISVESRQTLYDETKTEREREAQLLFPVENEDKQPTTVDSQLAEEEPDKSESLTDETGISSDASESLEAKIDLIKEMIIQNRYSEAKNKIDELFLVHPENQRVLLLKNEIEKLIQGRHETESIGLIDFREDILVLFNAKNYAGIIEIYEKDSDFLQKYSENDQRAYLIYIIGYSYKNTGNISRAYEILYSVLETDPGDNILIMTANELSNIFSIQNDLSSQIDIYLSVCKRIESDEKKKEAVDAAYEIYSFLSSEEKQENVNILENISLAYGNIKDNYGIFRTNYELGFLFYNKKSFTQAVESFNKAVSASRDIRITHELRKNIAFVQYHMGLCYHSLQDITNSIKAFEESLKFYEAYEPESDIYGKALSNISKLIPKYDTERKRFYLNKSMRFFAEKRDWEQYAEMAVEIAELSFRTEPQNSYNLLSGIQLSQVKSNDVKGKIHYFMGLSLDKLNKASEALEHFRNANRFFTQSRNFDMLGLVAFESSRIYYGNREFDKSLREINAARDNFTTSGNDYYLCYALYQESLIHIELKDRPAAREKANEGIRIIESTLKNPIDNIQRERLNELLQRFDTLKKNNLL